MAHDGVGSYMADTEHCGVWLSDRPLDANEGAWGDTTIAIAICLCPKRTWINTNGKRKVRAIASG
jgi:hypothetical protein